MVQYTLTRTKQRATKMSYATADKIRQLEVRRGVENAKKYGITDPVKAREIANRYWADYNKTGDGKWLQLAWWAESVCLGQRNLPGARESLRGIPPPEATASVNTAPPRA